MYGKIFEFMYEGSLYGQWEAIVTFQQMIVIADDEGFVDITPPALAAKTSIPLEIIEKGIEILESDDPYSRTPGEDGKRIIRISDKRPWGWQIVNYQKYRDMASNEDRKRYMREYMKERRKQEKLTSKQPVNNGKHPVANVTYTDTDTDKTFLSDSIEVRLSELLFNLILKNNPKAKKPNIQGWAKNIDLMIRIDKRDPNEIETVIRWCQVDEFWYANILSTSKLRKQFDQLTLKMFKKPEKQKKILTGKEAMEWEGS